MRAVGVADKAARAGMNVDFYSRIGSETTTFTVTVVLQLVDQSKVGLDDAITNYVDGVPRGDRITPRQLARMQRGLCNYPRSRAFQQAFVNDPHRHFGARELLGYVFVHQQYLRPGRHSDKGSSGH